MFIYRIDQFQSNAIYHYSNQKIDCIDSVRRMMTIGANTPLIIHSCHFFTQKKWKNKKLIQSKTTNILPIHLQNQIIPIKYYLSLLKSKNHPLRQCEAYDDYQSKCLIFIHSDDKNYVEKWKNKKLLRWKTTNILIVHLQNQMIPNNHHSLIIESKNRLHRQCEAYDDYQSKYPTYHSLKS